MLWWMVVLDSYEQSCKEVKKKVDFINILQTAGIGCAIVAVIALFMKSKKSIKVAKWSALIAVIGVIFFIPAVQTVAVGVIPSIDKPFAFGDGTGATVNGGTTSSSSSGSGFSTFQPSASYATQDKFATTSVTGTGYYKEGSSPATTTAISSVVKGKTYQYWLDNSSWWVTPYTFVAGDTNNVINKVAYTNSSATLTVLDGVNNKVVSSSGTGGNITLGANGVGNAVIKYQGTAKGSGGAFGGMMVVETNSSISSITCSSPDGVIAEGNPSGFQVTYTPSLTTHVGRLFEYTPALDDGSGAAKTINCQFQNGATAVTGVNDVWLVKFIPANYYVSQKGDILLDTEKAADNSNARTGSVVYLPSTGNMYWG